MRLPPREYTTVVTDRAARKYSPWVQVPQWTSLRPSTGKRMEAPRRRRKHPASSQSPHQVPQYSPNPFKAVAERDDGLPAAQLAVPQQKSQALPDCTVQPAITDQVSSPHQALHMQNSAFSKWQPSTPAPKEPIQDADRAESLEVSCSASDSAVMSDEALRIGERKLHTEARPAHSVPAPPCVRPKPIRPVAGSGPPYARPELPQARAVLPSVPVLQATDLVQQTVAAHYPRPWPSQNVAVPASPFMLTMSEARPVVGVRSAPDAASVSGAAPRAQQEVAAPQDRATLRAKQHAQLHRRPSKRFKPGPTPARCRPEIPSQNLEELAAMANAIVRQSSRQPFLHRHDGGTASSSQSPSSSGEPANQPQQQAASINMPMQPHARSAGLTSRQKPLPRQLAADVGQTEPGPATGDKVMSLHQQCLPARQAPQPALGAVDLLLQALIAKASQAKAKRGEPVSAHARTSSGQLHAAGEQDNRQAPDGSMQPRPPAQNMACIGLSQPGGAQSAGEQILSILLKMTAMRRKGPGGKAEELEAYTAELQTLCSNPAAAAQAMKLLKNVGDYSSEKASGTSTAAKPLERQ